jgi:Protein of unknown function (DUF4197)
MVIRVLALTSILAVGSAARPAQFDQIFKKLSLGKKTELSDTKIASGLKEALRVGTDNAVRSTGRPDGYFGNAAIKILMPEKLRTVEKGLRTVGYGPKVDDFVLSMNRAAERAAPHAKSIFLDAIMEMSFQDARKIFTGGDTAATDYFREKTTDKLTAAFAPVVKESMDEVGVTRQYNQMIGQARAIPFLKTQSLDLDHYVVSKALDGLFYELAQEETKIRKDPAARVTQLLKDVFGR